MSIQTKFRKLYQDTMLTKQAVINLERKLKKDSK